MPRVQTSVELPHPREAVFAYHERSGAIDRLVPPFEPARVVSPAAGVRDGEQATVEVRAGGIVPLRLIARHYGYEAGQSFHDEQVTGPFARLRHERRFADAGPGACRLTEDFDFELPVAALSGPIANGCVADRVRRMFAYRHATLARDLDDHARWSPTPRRFLITGSSGLVGSALAPYLTVGGHSVSRLSRKRGADAASIVWDPTGAEDAPLGELSGFDAVVHLAGAGIADGNWSAEHKRRIRESRVVGTRRLCEALARTANPPSVLVCASAVGFYGSSRAEVVDESSAPGDDFLAEVACEWEAAADAARAAGIRVVHLRFGMILSPRGGALREMLPAFRAGVAGRLSTGRQRWSWIALEDAIRAVLFAVASPDLSGPVNVVTPHPVTNAEFTATLARVLGRWVGPPAPAAMLRLIFGQKADALLLGDLAARPARLTQADFPFAFPQLEPALRFMLGRMKDTPR